MAIELVSPKYSFIRFAEEPLEEGCCDDNDVFLLPLVEETDCYFQVIFNCADAIEAGAVMTMANEDFRLMLLRGTSNDPGDIPDIIKDFTGEEGLFFERYRTGETTVVALWKNPLTDILNLIDCDECFQLALQADIPENDVILAISSPFKRYCDDCDLNVFEYYGEEDYTEFIYCNVVEPVNRVRLPIYFRQPQYPEEKGQYVLSDGSISTQYSNIGKEYGALVDFVDDTVHGKITTMLGHDFCYIESKRYTGFFNKKDDYAIAWDEDDQYCLAQSTFKAIANPHAVRNSNCADCIDFEIPGEECVIPVIESVSFNEDEELIVAWTDDAMWLSMNVQTSPDGTTWTDHAGSATSPRNLGAGFANTGGISIRLIAVCAEEVGDSEPSEVEEFDTEIIEPRFTIAYTNNDEEQAIELYIGNNNSSPSNELYNDLYAIDPVTGLNPLFLPAVDANVVLVVPGRTIVSASCNGVPGTIFTGSATWTDVNGELNISFITT